MEKDKKIKSGLYYPPKIYRALKRIYGEDIQNRKFNDIVIGIIEEHPIVQKMLRKIESEKIREED